MTNLDLGRALDRLFERACHGGLANGVSVRGEAEGRANVVAKGRKAPGQSRRI